jgi:hypothetical protein
MLCGKGCRLFGGTEFAKQQIEFVSGAGFYLAAPLQSLSSRNLNMSSCNLVDSSCNLAAIFRNLVRLFETIQSLAVLPDRLPETLPNLSPMCRTRELEMAFPDAPNDSRQAYTTRKP